MSRPGYPQPQLTPAQIAASVKAHEAEQKRLKQYHTKRGQRLISGRAALLSDRVKTLEEQVTESILELRSMPEDITRGRITVAEAKKRLTELMSARERLPSDIDTLTADLEAAADLDPIDASRDFSRRFPAMADKMVEVDGERYVGGPPLPESSNGDGD